MKKISIILPVFNSEKFIKRCIESVLNQSYQNLELIIVNDGSTDRTLEICQSFEADSRVVLIDKKNEGVSIARNRGLEVCSGDYIGFIDSDDHILPEMLEKMIEVLETENADIVECSFVNIKNGKEISRNILKDNHISKSSRIGLNFLERKNTTNSIWNKIFKKEIFADVRYPEYKYGEDFYVNALAAFKANIKVTLSNAYYYYEDNDDGAMRKKFNTSKLDNVKVRELLFREFVEKDIEKEVKNLIALDILSWVILLKLEMDRENFSGEKELNYLDNTFTKYQKFVTYKMIYQNKTKMLATLISSHKLNKKIFNIIFSFRNKIR